MLSNFNTLCVWGFFGVQKGSQEYIDATDLLDLYYEIRDELLVETLGDGNDMSEEYDDDGEAEDSVDLEQFQVRLA